MPRRREGYTQVPLEMPDELLEAVRAAAEAAGSKLVPWICAACAKAAGTEYTPPKLGRPPAVPTTRPEAAKPRRGESNTTPPSGRNTRRRGRRT